MRVAGHSVPALGRRGQMVDALFLVGHDAFEDLTHFRAGVQAGPRADSVRTRSLCFHRPFHQRGRREKPVLAPGRPDELEAGGDGASDGDRKSEGGQAGGIDR